MTLYVEDVVIWPPVFTNSFVLWTAQAPVELLHPSGALVLELEASALPVLQLVAVTHPDCLLGSVIYMNLEGLVRGCLGRGVTQA